MEKEHDFNDFLSDVLDFLGPYRKDTDSVVLAIDLLRISVVLLWAQHSEGRIQCQNGDGEIMRWESFVRDIVKRAIEDAQGVEKYYKEEF